MPKLSFAGGLGARLEIVTYKRMGCAAYAAGCAAYAVGCAAYAAGCAAYATPGENRANSGLVRLVPGPELSNIEGLVKYSIGKIIALLFYFYSI